MTLALITYLVFTALPAISTLSTVAFASWAILTSFGTFIGLMMAYCEDEDAAWNWVRAVLLKRWAKYAIACLVVANLVPTKGTAYMVGAYGVQTIGESAQVEELAGDGIDVLQQLMKKAKNSLEDIEEKK